MAAYEASRFIEEAVASVLAQSCRDFELIVVDDGSTDGTGRLVEQLSASNQCVRLVRQENRGLASARNAALMQSTGRLIAVADADDFQLPQRLELLAAAFDADPSLSVCGGWVESWNGGESAGSVCRVPLTDSEIRAGFPFESTIFDPTVMYRREAIAGINGPYSSEFRMAVDYDLWTRLPLGAKYRNLGKVLTRYRRHTGQLTQTEQKTNRSLEERRLVWSRQIRRNWGIEPTPEVLRANELLATWQPRVGALDRQICKAWIERLFHANRDKPAVPQLEFNRELEARLRWVCSRSGGPRRAALIDYFGSPVARSVSIGIRLRIGMVARCLRNRPE